MSKTKLSPKFRESAEMLLFMIIWGGGDLIANEKKFRKENGNSQLCKWRRV